MEIMCSINLIIYNYNYNDDRTDDDNGDHDDDNDDDDDNGNDDLFSLTFNSLQWFMSPEHGIKHKQNCTVLYYKNGPCLV